MSLLENEDYLEQYHEYLRQLAEEYVNGGELENTIDRITSQIDDLVETDPTSFYTYDEYTEAVDMLKETISLRAESVLGQLDGTIPSTTDGQKEDSSALIDASSIDLTVMGSMNGGGGGPPEKPDGTGDSSQGDSSSTDSNSSSTEPPAKPDGSSDSSNNSGGFSGGGPGGKTPPSGSAPSGSPPSSNQSTTNSTGSE